jgi:cytochrome P450
MQDMLTRGRISMAYHEMRLILTKVLYNFDIELLPESANWIDDQKVYSLWQKTPLMVKVKAVEST